MLGAVESLNVSVAAAVLLYEARRQRGWPIYLILDGYNVIGALDRYARGPDEPRRCHESCS